MEQLWPDGLAMVRRQTPLLSQNEMLDALREVGCTKQTIVDGPTQEFREKKYFKIKQLSAEFSTLAKEIEAKINELVQRDRDLARQLF